MTCAFVCVYLAPKSGDVMGPTLNNLDKLLRLPFGCGEQNMIHFAPNVFVLKYLQKTRQLSPEVENEATDYLLQGKEPGSQTFFLVSITCCQICSITVRCGLLLVPRSPPVAL